VPVSDPDYFARRADEQREAARRAANAAVRERHLELARLLAARHATSKPTSPSMAP